VVRSAAILRGIGGLPQSRAHGSPGRFSPRPAIRPWRFARRELVQLERRAGGLVERLAQPRVSAGGHIAGTTGFGREGHFGLPGATETVRRPGGQTGRSGPPREGPFDATEPPCADAFPCGDRCKTFHFAATDPQPRMAAFCRHGGREPGRHLSRSGRSGAAKQRSRGHGGPVDEGVCRTRMTHSVGWDCSRPKDAVSCRP
jgi:hypothetical protein